MEREGKHSSVGLYPRRRSWDKWLEAYTSAADLDTRIGLLYSGLQFPSDRGVAVIFYLQEAEGHCDFQSDFFTEDPHRESARVETFFGSFESVGYARRQVAKVAFNQLITHFFKDTKEKHEQIPSWSRITSREPVVDALLKFFRLNERQRFVNLQGFDSELPPHKAAVVREFLSMWAFSPWTSEGRLHERRVEFMDILCGLGQLDRLLNSGRTSQVGEVELKKLEELALQSELYLPCNYALEMAFRKPESIEEAAYAGSQAGKIAILLRSQLSLQKRYDEIATAIRERKTADRRLQELAKA